eukprot:TRINITY_DN64284_c0_g1_i2.p1 TRINITY_DN64284_c0_g1~~TRINITY_DN64284_c0_g1_i2.p1  ORF type:complete len:208 (-),score=22.02 TRINITY_DN64284_c0_g1_i2:166-789(-)
MAFLATRMLGEEISRQCMVGIFLCAVGAVLGLLFAPAVAPSLLYKPRDFFSDRIIAYFFGIGVLCIFSWPAIAKSSVSVRMIALPLLASALSTVEKLFNAAMGRLAPGESTLSASWLWLPSMFVMFASMGGVLTVAGLELQSTHTYVALAFAFGAVLLGVQSLMLGEFQDVPSVNLCLWACGLILAVVGSCLVVGSPGHKRCPTDAQ